MVHSTKVVLRIPTESNGTPAMDLGHMNIVLKWYMCMLAVDFGLGIDFIISMIIIIITLMCIFFFLLLFFVCGVH